jgi:hypothetical protein
MNTKSILFTSCIAAITLSASVALAGGHGGGGGFGGGGFRGGGFRGGAGFAGMRPGFTHGWTPKNTAGHIWKRKSFVLETKRRLVTL